MALEPLSGTEATTSNSPWPSWNLAFTALLVSLGGGFNFGYQLLITNPAQQAFIQFVNVSYTETHGIQEEREMLEFIWGVVVSMFFWGATVGALFIQTVADRYGRKNGVFLMFFVEVVSLAMAIASFFIKSYIMYAISRVVLGTATSVCIGIGPMFIVECSPVACRGMISMATGFMIQVGVVAGSILAMPEIWGTIDSWWLMYALELAITAFVTILVAFVPESPSFLVARKQMKKAESSFLHYHCVNKTRVESLLADAQKENVGERSFHVFEIFKDGTWICGFFVSAVVMIGVILSGVVGMMSDAFSNAFAFEILLNVGLNSLQASLANILICVMAAVGALLSSQLVERVGRRPLLLSTFSAIAVVNLVLSGFMYLFEWTTEMWIGWCVVVAICVFNLLFAAGPGPICFLVPGELVGQEARAATYTWVNIILNIIRSTLIAFYFPLRASFGGPLCYFLFFFLPTLVIVAICYYWLPETAARTLEEARIAVSDLPRICSSTRKSNNVNMDQQIRLFTRTSAET